MVVWVCDGNLWKIMPIISVFLACDGNLWEIMPISSIRNGIFVFFGLVMGTSGK